MHPRRDPPATGPSRRRAPQLTALVLAAVGLDPGMPVPVEPLGSAPMTPPDLPWALGAAVLVGLPALILYRRLDRSDVLSSENRRRVLEAVADEAPVTSGEVAEDLDLDYKTVLHHVRVLRDFELVEERRRGPRRHLYPAGEAPPRLDGRLQGMHETALRVLAAVAEEPGITQSAAARRLDVARSTVHWHVQELSDRGLVRDPDGAPGLVPGPALEEVRGALEEVDVGPPAA